MEYILEILKAVIYGVIEGITEWLPISSTGHMILAEQVLQFQLSKEFIEMFRVVIQLGAILAVVVLYFQKLWPFCIDNGRNTGFSRHVRWPVMHLWFKIIAACLPAAVLGILLDDWMDEHLYNSIVVALMLIVYGVAFLLIERRPHPATTTKLSRITYKNALAHRRMAGAVADSRYLPQRRHHPGRHDLRIVPAGGVPVHLLPGHSGHGRCQPAENRQVLRRRQRHHRRGDRHSAGGLRGGLPGLDCRHPFS